MIKESVNIRVRYQETDRMGIAYHGNFLTWFEVARVSLLDRVGYPYRELEKQGYYLPILEVYTKYELPAYFDDCLKVTATTKKNFRLRIRIDYEITREDKRLASGHTLHVFVNKKGQPVKPSAALIEHLNLYECKH